MIAGEQHVFFLERIGHVIGGVAGGRHRLDAPAIAAHDLAVLERDVGAEVAIATGIERIVLADMQRPRGAVRLPDGDLAGQAKRATTKSSVSRRFVALSTAKLKEWLASDLSRLDLLVIQIDGLHVGDHVLVVAIGIDGAGEKHVLALAVGGDGERRRGQGAAGRFG
jgi:hypothetical protein